MTRPEAGVPYQQTTTYQMAFIPAGENAFWKLLSYQFMHANWIHLISNLWYLAVFGWVAESLWGSKLYLVLSLIAGALAVLPERIFQLDPSLPIVGSSGAVAFAIGSLMGLSPQSKIKFLFSPIPIPEIPMTFWVQVKVLVYFWLFLQVTGLASNAWSDHPQPVAYATHLMGFLLGLLFAFFAHRRLERAPLK